MFINRVFLKVLSTPRDQGHLVLLFNTLQYNPNDQVSAELTAGYKRHVFVEGRFSTEGHLEVKSS